MTDKLSRTGNMKVLTDNVLNGGTGSFDVPLTTPCIVYAARCGRNTLGMYFIDAWADSLPIKDQSGVSISKSGTTVSVSNSTGAAISVLVEYPVL